MAQTFQPWSYSPVQCTWTTTSTTATSPASPNRTSSDPPSRPIQGPTAPVPLSKNQHLNLISWNIWNGPNAGARAGVLVRYLRDLLAENKSCPTVIMLQEVTRQSLTAILQSEWVRDNFAITDVGPVQQRLASYFTMMLLSRDIEIARCFRVPYLSKMSRDALVVDIRVDHEKKEEQCLRLSTTHLESLQDPNHLRLQQLTLMSTLLKAQDSNPELFSPSKDVIGGVVGGDLNSIHPQEHLFCERDDINLSDSWNDSGTQRKGTFTGPHIGLSSTYGENSCLDKFLYTGQVELTAMNGLVGTHHEASGTITRLGLGLKLSDYDSDYGEHDGTDHMRSDSLVSDHLGIAVALKVRALRD